MTQQADQDYWNGLWNPLLTKPTIEKGDRFVAGQTRKHLPSRAKVIDAGCGTGATVLGLRQAGFDAYGIDFAEETVATAKSLFPDINIRVADVRTMPFDDGYFDGVWSIGVIEHFIDGYDRIIAEARRVLCPRGFLFLTVPSISPLKKLKMKLGHYEELDSSELEDFFQFSFHPRDTVANVSNMGFQLLESFGRSGSFGLYEDAPSIAKWLLPDPNNLALPARVVWRGADIVLTPISFHTKYFLFQKAA